MKREPLSASAAEAPIVAPPHPAYRPDIDGLRAIAVLAVVLFHAFPGLLPGGFIGVDIFFIISGFLIGSIIMGEMAQQRFSFARFYGRRIKRIFPALALVMASCFAAGWLVLFADEYRMLGRHLVAGAGFVSNLLLWSEVGYFDTAADTKPLLHLWSLGIEEQFYIFWPILLMLAQRWRQRAWLWALVLGGLSFLLNVALVHRYPSATFYSPASRVWELLMGSMLAYLTLHGQTLAGLLRGSSAPAAAPSAQRRNLYSALGMALLLAGFVLITRNRAFPGWWALLPTTGAVLLIAAGPQAWCNRYVLAQPLLVWVGLISYPLYLWHWPLLSFAHILHSAQPAWQIRAAAVLLALLLAWLTYRVLEQRVRAPAHSRQKIILLSGVMTLVAAAGLWLATHAGLPQRSGIVANAALQKSLIVVEDVANAEACKARYGFASKYEYCLLDQVQQEPTVVLIGDSHAYHLVAGLTRYYHEHGGNLLMLGTRVPFIGLPSGDDPYQQATPRMLELALNSASVQTVIFSTALKLHEGNPDGIATVQALRTTLQRFSAAGKQLVWVNDVPMLDFEPRSCIGRPGMGLAGAGVDCTLPRATFDRNTAGHAAIVARLLKEFPQVKVFDTAAPLCDASRCHVMRDGKLMYRDTHHLSYDGDLYVASTYARQLGLAP